MKKFMAAILTLACAISIVATPAYKVVSPTITIGSSIFNNSPVLGGIITH